MTPLERAARALFDEEWENDPAIRWEDAAPDERQAWFNSARAVLQAIREPSDAMCEAVDPYGDRDSWADWQKMIDAALEEG